MSTFGHSISLDKNFGVGNINLDEFNSLTAPTILGQVMRHRIKWDNKPAALDRVKECLKVNMKKNSNKFINLLIRSPIIFEPVEMYLKSVTLTAKGHSIDVIRDNCYSATLGASRDHTGTLATIGECL